MLYEIMECIATVTLVMLFVIAPSVASIYVIVLFFLYF